MDVTEPSTESTSVASERDVLAIQYGDWARRELGHTVGPRESRFQVVFRQSVLDEIHLHGQSAPSIEVCGVLVGTGYRDARGPYLLIEHCIRGNGATSQSTNVTFTADTWQHIQDMMDRKHPTQKILGWYHTHPGFGIFLSEMDVFICDNFFNLPWQIAFVYDPQSGEEGNFVWRGGKPQPDPVLIENDVTLQSANIPLISAAEAMRGQVQPPAPQNISQQSQTQGQHMPPEPNEHMVDLLVRVRRLERRQKVLLWLMTFLIAFVAFWAVEFTPDGSSVPVQTKPTTAPTTASATAVPPAAVAKAGAPAPSTQPTIINPTNGPLIIEIPK